MKKRNSKHLLWASCVRIEPAAGRAALRRTIVVSDVWADAHSMMSCDSQPHFKREKVWDTLSLYTLHLQDFYSSKTKHSQMCVCLAALHLWFKWCNSCCTCILCEKTFCICCYSQSDASLSGINRFKAWVRQLTTTAISTIAEKKKNATPQYYTTQHWETITQYSLSLTP